MVHTINLNWTKFCCGASGRTTKYESGDWRIDTPNDGNEGRYELFYKYRSVGFYNTIDSAKSRANREDKERQSNGAD